MARVTVTYSDFEGDTTSLSLDNSTTLSGANFAAQENLANAVIVALNGITNGKSFSTAFGNYEKSTINTPAPQDSADNVKWSIRYRIPATGAIRRVSLGTADLDLPRVARQEENGARYSVLDPTHASYTALKTAFDAFVTDADGNPCELTEVFFINS